MRVVVRCNDELARSFNWELHSRSRRSSQETSDGQIFVDVRPVDAVASPGNLPISPLLFRGIEQPWIPGKWNGDGPAIR